MGRLTSDQRRELSQFHKAGHSIEQCARKFSVTWLVAQKWILEGCKRHPRFSDLRRSGRPQALSRLEKRSVTRFAKLGKSAKYIAVQLNKKRSDPVHPTTVSRYLRLGTKHLDYLPVVTKRKLRIENKQKRTVFCRRHRGHDFKRCVFVDGKTLRFKYGDGKLRSHCWQDPKNRKCKPPDLLIGDQTMRSIFMQGSAGKAARSLCACLWLLVLIPRSGLKARTPAKRCWS